MVALAIAFLFLFTPAQERIEAQLTKWFDELLDEYGPAREYPVHAVFTAERRVNLFNPDPGDMSFTYELPMPLERTDFGSDPWGFETVDADVMPADVLQQVTRMEVRSAVTNAPVTIPLSGSSILLEEDAHSLDANTRVYWPPTGDAADRCSVGRCVIWSGSIEPGQTATLVVEYDITGSSFSWWGGDAAPEEAPRSSAGIQITAENAGSYADLERNGRMGSMKDAFGDVIRWYDRDSGGGTDWAIDGLAPNVVELANEIEASLSADQLDSPFAFAHAAFIEIRDSVTYSQGLSPARSGSACIAEGRGDCDEQSNAWMSLLRTRDIPAWYEFGPMTDGGFEIWEPHAWANVILPLDGTFCATEGIAVDHCFVEAEVDVVNNKWLLHTPITITEWIETPSHAGEAAYDFYRPLAISCANCWTESWTTLGDPIITGGTFRVPVRIGE